MMEFRRREITNSWRGKKRISPTSAAGNENAGMVVLARPAQRCPTCDEPIPSRREPRGRPRVYCADECRLEAWRMAHRSAPLGYELMGPCVSALEELRRLGHPWA